jgi:mannose-6-phosphate isomerase-like protein (cupin superfamily)
MLEPVLVELLEGGTTNSDVPHEGEEFGYVLEGKIAIMLGKNNYTCKKGDAFYYNASKPHTIINKGKGKAKFIWVSTPPNF